MRRRACLAALLGLPLAGCISGPGQFVKSDVDRIADMHRREAMVSLNKLAEKLYRRNPREWRKGGHESLEVALARLAEPGRAGISPEPVTDSAASGRRSTAMMLAALGDDYSHDRVSGFIGGLTNMVYDAFGGKFEFFLLDELDAQKLHNAARNVEIAAWKLANAKRTQPEADLLPGSPLLLSNEIAPLQNLSFEREFGKLISNLDMLSQIAADKNQRFVVKVVQNLATAAFIPIPIR